MNLKINNNGNHNFNPELTEAKAQKKQLPDASPDVAAKLVALPQYGDFLREATRAAENNVRFALERQFSNQTIGAAQIIPVELLVEADSTNLDVVQPTATDPPHTFETVTARVQPFTRNQLYDTNRATGSNRYAEASRLSPSDAARAVLGAQRHSTGDAQYFMREFVVANQTNPARLQEFYRNLGAAATGRNLATMFGGLRNNSFDAGNRAVIDSLDRLQAAGQFNQADMNNLVRGMFAGGNDRAQSADGLIALRLFTGSETSSSVRNLFVRSAINHAVASNNRYLAAAATDILARQPVNSLPANFDGLSSQDVRRFFGLAARGQQFDLPTEPSQVGNVTRTVNNLAIATGNQSNPLRNAAFRGLADGLQGYVDSTRIMSGLSSAVRGQMRDFYLSGDRLIAGGELKVLYPNPTDRNYAVTRQYRELSDEMASIVGRDNANWATFAVWASDEAGRAIRRENFLVRATDATRITQTGKNISQGNTLVFSEIGPVFRRFVDTYRNNSNTSFNEFWRQTGLPANHGLRSAFEAYHQAMLNRRSGGNADQRAELMLLANARVGLYEQTNLQPDIQDALRTFGLVVNPLGLAGGALDLHFPNTTLDLNRDLGMTERLIGSRAGVHRYQTMNGNRSVFPQQLAQLQNRELAQLADRFGGLHGTGNAHWENFEERMQFIFNLFRLYQQDGSLFQNPRTVFPNN